MALIGSAGGQQWPPAARREDPAVKRYDVVINGVRTTVQLSDADAKARGLLTEQLKAKEAPTPRNKAAKAPANKAGQSKK